MNVSELLSWRVIDWQHFQAKHAQCQLEKALADINNGHNILFLICLCLFTGLLVRFFRQGYVLMCALLQQVVQPQHARWNLVPLSLSVSITSSPNRLPPREPCHNTSAPHAKYLFRNMICRNACLFIKTAKRYSSRRDFTGDDDDICLFKLMLIMRHNATSMATWLAWASMQPVIIQRRSLLLCRFLRHCCW